MQIIDGQRFFEGKKLANAVMLWKCATAGCTTPPKPQRRGQYENKFRCNACSNREKAKDPELLKRRGKAIDDAIACLGNKWSEVASKNMSSKEVREKISESTKKYISENQEEALRIRRDTALKNIISLTWKPI